jgi:glycosyltransferase involved in cell wall biosynthesis
MPRLSLLMPTLRPDYADNAIRQVLMCSGGNDYELIVVSPFPVAGDRIRHVPEAEPEGDSAAYARALAVASGDIVLPMIDDFAPAYGWLDGIEAAVAEGERRGLPFCGSLYWTNHPWFNTAYGRYYAFFPVMSRRSIDRVGGYIDTVFRANFGDVDLSLRVWDAGGHCALLPRCPIYKARPEDEARLSPYKRHGAQADFAQLVGRWHARLGADRPASFDGVIANHDIVAVDDPTWFAGHSGRIG